MNATDYRAFIRDECIRYDFAREREYLLLGLRNRRSREVLR